MSLGGLSRILARGREGTESPAKGKIESLHTAALANLFWSSSKPASQPSPPTRPTRPSRPSSASADEDDIADDIADASSRDNPTMATQPARPALTPQLCFSTVALRDFLRMSRAVDDTITQSLNALVTPARAGFDPASTATRVYPSASPSHSSSRFSPSPSACRNFRDSVLFPAWQARDDVIRYCTGVAEAAEAAAAEKADKKDGLPDALDASDPRLTERYDPYIRRRRFAEVEPEADRLAALMRQERGVETIVRARSWEVLQNRCGTGITTGIENSSWEAALDRWRLR
ncbi:caffeine-induced death protein [Grosmannia clavigera kw1407]|uniref:Caffeine-induced death protein n=1 Tax=Grosmannia clavigera (strain kw1407 / UAMH 11150) TaxID=655863 RepID=F0XJE9_GROCL|nr:caffeine-induced death protein [Grosmannia clavigera kw1407]EFX02045.1 caffeine-induced death protein [Grosmannia clavigera kw1407]